MRVRRVKILLTATGAALLVLAVLALALAIRLPYASAEAQRPAGPIGNRSVAAHAAGLPRLDEFAPLWDVDLRRSLADEPAPTVAAVQQPTVPQAPTFSVRLVGTAVDPGGRFALLVGSDGSVAVKSAGDQIDGAEIVEIRDGSVTLRHNGQNIDLEVPKPQQAP